MANHPQAGPDSNLYRKAQALGFLPAAIANRRSLVPFAAEEQDKRLNVPQWRDLEPAIMSLRFSIAELEEIELTGELLKDLVAKDPESLLPHEFGEHGASQQLVRRPLRVKGDSYIYTLPCRCLDSVIVLVSDAFNAADLKEFCVFLAEL